MSTETAAVVAPDNVNPVGENTDLQEGKTTEQAELKEPEPAQETEAEREAKHQAKLEKRFSKLTKRTYQAEARAELLEREIQSLRGKPEQNGDVKESDDIDSIVERKLAAREQEKLAKDFTARSLSLLERASVEGDFDVDDFIRLPQGAADAVVETDNPKLLAYLQNNPEEIERLSELSYQRQAVEIGKLEAKLSAPAVVKKSAAPQPIKPIAAKTASGNEYRADMSDADYAAWRRANSKR